MLLQVKNRRVEGRLLKRKCGLAFALALFFSGSSPTTLAQLSRSPAPPPSKAESTDPLHRETPRSALEAFLRHEGRQDFATAAHYLQALPGEEGNLPEEARELQALRGSFKGDLALVSNEPDGAVEPGLPPGEVRAGLLKVGSATADVILVRVNDPNYGKIWLVSNETVAKIPGLYAQVQGQGPTAVEGIVPATLRSHHLLGMSLAQWIGWILSIPVSWFLAWLLAFLSSVPRRIWRAARKVSFKTIWETNLGLPLLCILAIVVHGIFVYLLEPPLLYREYYFRFLAAVLVTCLAWLVSRVADLGFEHAVNRRRTTGRGGESILVLVQRVNRITLLIIAFVAALALFGVNVKTTLAGLGIGGLAIALVRRKLLRTLSAACRC